MGEVDVAPGVVLGLTTHPDSPGQRFRIHNWAPHLERVGLSYSEMPFATAELERLLLRRASTAPKLWRALQSAVTYPLRFPETNNVNVLYVYIEAIPAGPPIVERWIKRRLRVPMIFDMDDPIFIPIPSASNAWASVLRDRDKWRKLCAMADLTLCVNELICEYLRPLAGRVEVVPNTVDVSAYDGHRPERTIPVLGYSGSRSTTSLLRLIEPALTRLSRTTRFELHVVGGPSPLDLSGPIVREVPWSAANERDILLGFDIGLAPAPDTEWNRYKSFVKVPLYMASGLPVVASPVGLPAELIRHGENGFLAKTEDEWVDTLALLMRDPELRRRVGLAGRETVRDRFSPQKHLPRVQQLFLEVAGLNRA